MYGNTCDPILPVIVICNIENESFHKIVSYYYSYIHITIVIILKGIKRLYLCTKSKQQC